ncbi:MAG: HoxN/HupN/NixA family nickel/cobalt transporter [Acidiferrobacter sp.]
MKRPAQEGSGPSPGGFGPALGIKRVRQNAAIYPLAIVGFLNLLAAVALLALRAMGPAVMGMGMLAYFLGLRHAFDIDHIAAIDNVARKLREQGLQSRGVGLYFSLGHSTVVILLSLAVATVIRTASPAYAWISRAGAFMGTGISASFLLLMGLMNLSIFVRLVQLMVRRVPPETKDREARLLSERRGFLVRFLATILRAVHYDWQMYFVGLLFGLGFDTATEVAVLGISASMAQHDGTSLWRIMIFPLLFTAGMTLLDTLDGMAVTQAYDWTMRDAARKMLLNAILTGLGVVAALVVSLTEWLRLLGSGYGWHGFADWRGNMSTAGGAFTGVIIVIWGMAWWYYRKVLVSPEPAPLSRPYDQT